MCGIAGYYEKGISIKKELFENMVDMVSYRGPDGRGTYYEDDIALGHRRLSVIDTSEAGAQPLHYDNRYIVVYNGEIYNYIEIKELLLNEGYRFNSCSDSEVLVAAYSFWGEKCVEHFIGMWAFAIYDRQEKSIFASRDPYGIKPFYYYYSKNKLVFSSEIKQIIYVLNTVNYVNLDVLMNYLINGRQDYSEDTFFRNIKQLRPGCVLKYNISNDSLVVKKYYYYKNKCNNNSFSENADYFRKEFENSISLHLRSDVPVGFCLSGGLDSSAIVCMTDMIKNKHGDTGYRLHTISSCFDDYEYDEQEYIDEVVKRTNVESHKIFPRMDELWEKLDEIIFHMDEPICSSSVFAQWSVFREAKAQGLTVMLDGQGADEQLAGYTEFYEVRFADLFRRLKFITLYSEYRSYCRLRACHENNYLGLKTLISAFAHSIPLPKCIRKKKRMYQIKKMLVPFSEKQMIKYFVNNCVEYNRNNPDKYIIDNFESGLQALLHFEDRNSMAFSIESRVPFLCKCLVDVTFEIPFEHKINGGVTKVVLREALKDVLPEKIFNRYSKLGFVTPEDKWMNSNPDFIKKEFMNAIEVLSPILPRDTALKWFEKEGYFVRRGDSMLWRILCAAKWVKVFDVKF